MIARAVLVDFDDTDYLATVRYTASLAGTVAGVPVSRALAAGDLTEGALLAVAVFDPAHPTDAVVVAVH